MTAGTVRLAYEKVRLFYAIDFKSNPFNYEKLKAECSVYLSPVPKVQNSVPAILILKIGDKHRIKALTDENRQITIS